jgi:HD-GYP domain-containing protein (c-di-GMP phosphodiesterase class II)
MEKRPSKALDPASLYPSAFMAEYVFRGLRKQGVIQSDSQAMKQYYNLHQDEIKKEVESLMKKASDQALRSQLISRLERKSSAIKGTIKNFAELERFLETTLQLGDKDSKKFVIFNIILASAKSLTDISL